MESLDTLFPVLVILTSAATWGFHALLKRYAQGEVRERYLDRFGHRVEFSKIITAAALVWLITTFV